MNNLVIVESPAKAKTIKKYLGSGYEVIASMGHVIDLPKSKLGVDVENNFDPQYINIRGKEKIIKSLKTAAKASDKIYLATDPDREGEAISWHLARLLGLDLADNNRVTFNEITKTGVKNGMDNPRIVDMNLVNAQQARRILDRIVGYKLSPFLWKKVKRGLSAGRVQSVVVAIIVSREEEICAFIPEEYWSLSAFLTASGSKKAFEAKFYGDRKGKIELKDDTNTSAILKAVEQSPFIVEEIKKGTRKKNPSPPFVTSTLQQEASKKLNFQSTRTMRIAQQLYEGVDIKGIGATGLITYMRTDSLRISDEAKAQARDYISNAYSPEYLPEKPRNFATKKSAQDGHEAIRPSNVSLAPNKIKDSLTSEQYRLYKIIWERFVASQMAQAVYNTVKATISSGDYIFKANGYSVKFDGFTVLYEMKDDSETMGNMLPAMKEGETLSVEKLEKEQHFTQPPARYTEASLIKTLEENGIGRPSTYATTIQTVINRGYVEREAKSLKPTVAGEVTTKLMKDHFESIVDVGFTATMEDDLDKIEDGKIQWVVPLKRFYDNFDATLQKAEKDLEGTRVKIPDEETEEICEKCGRNMVIKTSKFGKFLACPGFPECQNTKRLAIESGGICAKCGGKILQKKTQKNKVYYGCENNPTCDFMTWDIPLTEKCPTCGKTLFRKKIRGGNIYCVNCDFTKERTK